MGEGRGFVWDGQAGGASLRGETEGCLGGKGGEKGEGRGD